jgi:hypothetical protein
MPVKSKTARKPRKERKPAHAARQADRERHYAIEIKPWQDSWAIRTGGAITSDLLAAAGLV